MTFDKAAIDARAKAIGLTTAQVTPTIRVALLQVMVDEEYLKVYKDGGNPVAIVA